MKAAQLWLSHRNPLVLLKPAQNLDSFPAHSGVPTLRALEGLGELRSLCSRQHRCLQDSGSGVLNDSPSPASCLDVERDRCQDELYRNTIT